MEGWSLKHNYSQNIITLKHNNAGKTEKTAAGAAAVAMTVWQIVSKVRVEAFCWGAGTALGELPPYFMAR